MVEKFIDFGEDFVCAKFLFGTGRDQVSFFVFEFFFAINKIDIALDEVVVENFFFNEVFAVMVFEYFFEFVFFISVGI